MTRTLTSSISSGRKTVASAGTAERLSATSANALWITIQAETDNTGRISIGSSSTIAAAGSTANGVVLVAGASISFGEVDIYDLYLDSSVSGDGVVYTYGEA